LIAGYQALAGKKVDIITSNNSLAKRDAEESEIYFQRLGLDVAYLPDEKIQPTTDEEQEGKKQKTMNEIYACPIIYSTVHNFCVAYLKQFMVDEDLTITRDQEFLIVDEVDSMLIDKPEITTYISQQSYYEKHLKKIFDNLMEVFLRVWQNNEVDTNEDSKQLKKLKKELKKFLKEKAGEEENSRFKDLVKKKADVWIENLFKAQEMKKNVEYVVTDNKIKILDSDTGETQKAMQWSDGLHYFIEQKHGILNNSFNSTFLFENHMTFMKKYKSNIVGLSGTLGSKVCMDFLDDKYKVDMFIVPTYCENRYSKQLPVICKNRKKWHKKILSEVKECNYSSGRPILIIFENIEEALEFDNLLKKNDLKSKHYLRSDDSKHSEDESFFKLKNNSIILATNLGGRGTDFQVKDKLSQKGGLHVIVTFIPTNSRVERQAFGRAGRKGQLGSGKMIVNLKENEWLGELVNILSKKLIK
jgi:preprotein translocase subunit SecA